MTAHPPTPDRMAEAGAMPCHLAAIIPGMGQERGVDRGHQRKVQGRPADRYRPALRHDRQAGMLPLNHLPWVRHVHRANPFDKTCRLTTSRPNLACSVSISQSPVAFAASLASEKAPAMPSVACRLPCRDHRRADTVLGQRRSQRLVTTDRIQRHPGLERACITARASSSLPSMSHVRDSLALVRKTGIISRLGCFYIARML
jgi:hypothetical protein